MKRFRLGRLTSIALIFLTLLALFSFRASTKDVIKSILESNWTVAIIWITAIVSVSSDRWFSEGAQENTSFIYTNFGSYADAIFCIATFGFSGSTSVALLSGIYSQILFEKVNFVGFGNFDLASIFVISSFLLFYSWHGMLKLIYGVIFQAEATSVDSTPEFGNAEA